MHHKDFKDFIVFWDKIKELKFSTRKKRAIHKFYLKQIELNAKFACKNYRKIKFSPSNNVNIYFAGVFLIHQLDNAWIRTYPTL